MVSEADLDAVRAEFETRLAASDRKVYALSKERDALRRGNEKLATLTDLLKEKDAIISQACAAPCCHHLKLCCWCRPVNVKFSDMSEYNVHV